MRIYHLIRNYSIFPTEMSVVLSSMLQTVRVFKLININLESSPKTAVICEACFPRHLRKNPSEVGSPVQLPPGRPAWHSTGVSDSSFPKLDCVCWPSCTGIPPPHPHIPQICTSYSVLIFGNENSYFCWLRENKNGNKITLAHMKCYCFK